jgi:lipopolysaccharide/colanic/teichoic acid biosynthesis glycosyltransferase
MAKTSLTPGERVLKRTLDLMLAGVLLALTWWIILLAWAGACLSTGRNGFFLQERIGQWGRPFKIIKIRTMKALSAAPGTTITTLADPRITPFGRLLRRTKIDELPQLFNVVAGQMSFVGPRPDVPGYADQLEGEARAILCLKAGITGPATLHFRDEERLLAEQDDPETYNRTVIFPMKVKLNLEYLDHYSIGNDLKYIIRTAFGHHPSAMESAQSSIGPPPTGSPEDRSDQALTGPRRNSSSSRIFFRDGTARPNGPRNG